MCRGVCLVWFGGGGVCGGVGLCWLGLFWLVGSGRVWQVVPWAMAGRPERGVRVILENSTVCQKSTN